MRIEWLNEAASEYHDLLLFYKHKVGAKYAKRISEKTLGAVSNLRKDPETGVLRSETLLGKYDFRTLFVEQYVVIYRIEAETILIYHLTDARTNYIYNIFGFEENKTQILE